jgi:GT2 family glycosyltransferase
MLIYEKSASIRVNPRPVAEMSSPLVYVVILTWNHLEDTLACLETVQRLTYPCYRLLVVDNASTDGTPAAIAARFPAVEVIVNAANLGYAAGNNVGLQRALEAGADYVLLLNNDTLAAPDMLDELVAAALADPQAGLLSPKMYYADHPDRLWYAGARLQPLTLAAVHTHRGESDIAGLQTPQAVDYVFGCAMLIQRAVLEEVGLFDPGYFMYYEDADFCLHVRAAGYRLLYVPRARLWHRVAASTQEQRLLWFYYRAQSRGRLLRQHTNGAGRLFAYIYHTLSALWTTLKALAQGNSAIIGPYWRGWWEGMRQPLSSR